MRLLILVLVLLAAGCTSHSRVTSQTFTYDVVDSSGGHTRQVIDIQRPYRARTLTFKDGASQGGFLWDETGTYTVSPDGSIAQTAAIAPGFPGPAGDLALALPVALRQRRVVRHGTSTSGGKQCELWESSDPLDSGSPFAPPGQTTAESCVDARGVILSERWSGDTGLLQARTLVSTSTGPSSLYGGKTPQPLASPASVVKPSTAAELSKLLQIPNPAGPLGLRPDKAVAALDVDSARQGYAREAGVFTWVGGGHLAVVRVERDLESGGGRTIRGESVPLGQLGTGHLEPVLAGLRVLVEGPRGLRLIATADLPETELLSWLRSLSF